MRIECATEDSSATFLWSELKVAKAKLRPLETENGKLIDGDRRSRINVSVTADKPKQAFFVFESAIKESELTLTLGVENAKGTTQWRMFATTASAELIASESIIAIAKKESSKRTARDQKQLIDYRKAQLADYRRLTDEATALRKEVADVEAEIPTTLVMDEQKEPRPTFILMRGAYDKPSDPVSMATPTVLPQPAADLPKNRLGLARWLVSPENPLTARVTVNRFWQQFFGEGLVRSSEDFGSQGDLPSHPELLDWLAVDFQESSWDVKRLVKMFVMSETYQQSSSHPADGNQNPDPFNKFRARTASSVVGRGNS